MVNNRITSIDSLSKPSNGIIPLNNLIDKQRTEKKKKPKRKFGDYEKGSQTLDIKKDPYVKKNLEN